MNSGPAMALLVNGVRRELPQGSTVLDLLQSLDVRGRVAVERNGTVLRQAEHAQTVLAEGDVVEVVTFVGGGA